MAGNQESPRSDLELRQQYEIRKMELAVEFAKYGFYGTLVGALTGMVILVALTIVVAWGKVENGGTIIAAFAGALAIAVISFGYFSLFRSPTIGIEWRDLKASMKSSDDDSASHGSSARSQNLQ